MSLDLPFALGCPSCPYHVVVSAVDPDARVSTLAGHIFQKHADYSRAKTNQLLAEARDLTAAEVA